jgi:hypothetical protein
MRTEYKNVEDMNEVLLIRQSGEHWEFDLAKNLVKLQEEHPGLHSDALYLVGYRDEERPSGRELGIFTGDGRINIPYVAVHALPNESQPPNCIMSTDYLLKTALFPRDNRCTCWAAPGARPAVPSTLCRLPS